ncbi:unnamed protein product [Pocillopora meandrina]|uniref:B box-type domain-containing protein n=1 Tax=Pocillopora meandrina TaxID=46732 RepID=A0AAU9W8J7_9CNID|nr:unnamed protein product [Pocillopora meandrina]
MESIALYKSQEGSRVSTVSRNCQRSQDTAMSTLFLSVVYRQTRRICKRKLEATIKCPLCQACFQIPEGDTFGNLPTSFHLNRLVDLLALRNDGEEAQRCSNCEENNTVTCYCFVCQTFLCKDCFDAHQRLKATRGIIIL